MQCTVLATRTQNNTHTLSMRWLLKLNGIWVWSLLGPIHLGLKGYWKFEKILIKKYWSNSSTIYLGRKCNRTLLSSINWLILLGIRQKCAPQQKINYCTYLSGWQQNLIDYKGISPLSTTLNVLTNLLL